MKTPKIRLSISLFFMLQACAFTSSAQWNLNASINRAVCDEAGADKGSIVLSVSGTPGPYTYSWSNGSTDFQILNLHPGIYTVNVENGMGLDTTAVFTVLQWECEPTPSPVFTPNGDGINDLWMIDNSVLYPNMLVSVFNRWGQKMYEHKGNYVPWDGRSLLGLPLDGETYFYIIFEDADKPSEGIVKGSVTIVR